MGLAKSSLRQIQAPRCGAQGKSCVCVCVWVIAIWDPLQMPSV